MSPMVKKNKNLTTRHQFLQQDHKQEAPGAQTLKARLKEKPAVDKDAGGAATHGPIDAFGIVAVEREHFRY